MQLTVRFLGLEVFHVELCDSEEPDDWTAVGSTPISFMPSPGDQRWEQGVDT